MKTLTTTIVMHKLFQCPFIYRILHVQSTITKAILTGLLSVLLFFSCSDEYVKEEGESKLVIEGWIEECDVAHVLLSRSIKVSELIDSSNYMQHAIKSSMVIVSDDTESDTLRLTYSSKYSIPFLYTGEKIIGKTGGKYKLTVKHFDKIYTAETTIPPSVPIDKVEFLRKNSADTVGNIAIEFKHPEGEHGYYQISTMLYGFDEIFVPCLYANFNSQNFPSSDVRIELTRGITIFPKVSFHSYFIEGDTIFVKLRTMPKEGFDFWNQWQNEIINAQNPIFPANKSLKSNISGGIGIWCGYGYNIRRIIVK